MALRGVALVLWCVTPCWGEAPRSVSPSGWGTPDRIPGIAWWILVRGSPPAQLCACSEARGRGLLV